MGGEEKDTRPAKQARAGGAKQPRKAGVSDSDAEISKLLKHFNSAELFSQSGKPSESKKNNDKTDKGCDDVVTTFKHLHVRRPELRKHRKAKKNSKYSKYSTNLLNLAVAAGNFQKPIVWPARLSCGCKKPGTPLLYPSRLQVPGSQGDTSARSALDSNGKSGKMIPCCSCKLGSRKEHKASRSNQHYASPQFGQEVSASSLSFSSLCPQQGTASTPRKGQPRHPASSSSSSSESHQPGQQIMQDPHFSGQQLFTNTPLRHLPTSTLLRAEALLHPIPSNNNVTSASGIYATTSSIAAAARATNRAAQPHLSTSSSRLQQHPTFSASSTSNCGAGPGRSCSQEVRDMEDTNVTELASYLEDLLHIPRKMSTMAEMMYA